MGAEVPQAGRPDHCRRTLFRLGFVVAGEDDRIRSTAAAAAAAVSTAAAAVATTATAAAAAVAAATAAAARATHRCHLTEARCECRRNCASSFCRRCHQPLRADAASPPPARRRGSAGIVI